MTDNIIYEHDKIHHEMCSIIDTASKYIFLCCFRLDIHYNKEIYKSLINALERGIRIYIITSERNQTPIDIIHRNLYCKNNVSIYETPIDFEIINNLLQTYQTAKFVLHSRFIYNGKALLVGSINSDRIYSGSVTNMSSTEYKFYDFGVVTYKFPDKYSFFIDIYNNISSRNIYISKSLAVTDAILTCSNKQQYEFIQQCIPNSEHSITIINQYFFTCDTYTNNIIHRLLAERIKRAISKNEKFVLRIYTNVNFYDEVESLCYLFGAFNTLCLYKLRESLNVSDDVFNRYVKIYVPRCNRVILHAKMYKFDNCALITSANLADRSFSNTTGDYEMGIIYKKYSPNINGFDRSIFIRYTFTDECNTLQRYVDKNNKLSVEDVVLLTKIIPPIVSEYFGGSCKL